MYAVLRGYAFDPASSAELKRQMTNEYVPLLRHLPGFVACYWLDSGAGTGAWLCAFEDQTSAATALAQLADRIPAQLAALAGAPEVLAGVVTVYANAGL